MKIDDVSLIKLMELVKDDPALQAKIGQLQQAAVVARKEAARVEILTTQLRGYEGELKKLDERVQASLADLAHRESKLTTDLEAARDTFKRADRFLALMKQAS